MEAIKSLIAARVPIGVQIAAAVIQSHVLTLGGKLGLKSERDGPYLLLRGFQKLLAYVNTLAVFKRYGQPDALLKLLDAL